MQEKPEKVDVQPRINLLQEEGTIDLGTLVHVSSPTRIDWHLIASQEKQQKVGFQVLGPLDQVTDYFIALMTKFLSSPDAPEIKRMALGSILLIPGETKEIGYKRLSIFLPHVEFDIENTSDFLYQINRPTKSHTIAELSINRLSKWSVAGALGVGIMFDGKPQLFLGTEGEFACRLELDINTSQNYDKIIPKEQLTSILRELKEISLRIPQEGDK